jgi:hypothetical protein
MAISFEVYESVAVYFAFCGRPNVASFSNGIASALLMRTLSSVEEEVVAEG